MSVHEDLLNNGENNCSFTEDEVDIMCSEDGDDACGDGCLDVKGQRRIGVKAQYYCGFGQSGKFGIVQDKRFSVTYPRAKRLEKCES